MLAAPLVLKLAGTNAVIVIAAIAGLVVTSTRGIDGSRGLAVVGSALFTSLVVSIGLGVLALGPLRQIERTLERFRSGDAGARVPEMPLADGDMRRVARTLNAMFDEVLRDRDRLHQLAQRVVTQGDRERSQLARDLYDSTAQSITAALLELRAASATTRDAAARERLERVRRIASDVLDEIRAVSQAAHPRLLEDEGLGAALHQLVKEYGDMGTSRVSLDADADMADVRDGAGALVYRVAQSALREAVMVRDATAVAVSLGFADGALHLAIEDNGRFDHRVPTDAEAIESIRQRIELAGGSLQQTWDAGRARTRLVLPRRPRSTVAQPYLAGAASTPA